ncbi:MAG: hypothetical protein EOM76_00145 [Sphingobacteriia bacterium]|jgi:hypothetical protein|nr:FkbM family methyltransferase [Paludibacteraceae bacterium]NCA78600.1 hypothetical protein [Sphingobacteriia bacterium]
MLTSFYQRFVPAQIRSNFFFQKAGLIAEGLKNHKMVQRLLHEHKKNCSAEDMKPLLEYARHNRFTLTSVKLTFLSPFVEKYKRNDAKVFYCEQTQLYYVVHKEKKLYWKRGVDPFKISWQYMALLAEQDAESPHHYWTKKTTFNDQILFDIGAAEGLITLDHITELKHAYLFECDSLWIEALKATFKPYADKISLVGQYVAEKTDPQTNFISIDDFSKQKNITPDLIKMDIEGFEEAAICGCERTIKQSPKIEIEVCAYHKPQAYEQLNKQLTNLGCTCLANPGYIYFYNDQRKPLLRKGVIHAVKE